LTKPQADSRTQTSPALKHSSRNSAVIVTICHKWRNWRPRAHRNLLGAKSRRMLRITWFVCCRSYRNSSRVRACLRTSRKYFSCRLRIPWSAATVPTRQKANNRSMFTLFLTRNNSPQNGWRTSLIISARNATSVNSERYPVCFPTVIFYWFTSTGFLCTRGTLRRSCQLSPFSGNSKTTSWLACCSTSGRRYNSGTTPTTAE